MKDYEDVKEVLKRTLLDEVRNELMTEVLKRRRKANKRKDKIMEQIITDSQYAILPEPSEHIKAQFNVTPRGCDDE